MYLDMDSKDFKTDNPEKEALIALKLQEMIKNHIENLKCFSENEPNTTFTSKEILGQFQKLIEESKK